MKSYNSQCVLLLALSFIFILHWTGVRSAGESYEDSDESVLERLQFIKDRMFFASEEEMTEQDSSELDIFADKTAATVDDVNWDMLIFTQQWPVTLCYHWREEDKDHRCVLPSSKEFWTIHGIWPTRKGQMGPNFCNKSADFDVNQLAEIEQRLEEYWPDIDGSQNNHNWLWKHEWLKHGTCAAALETLDNERKYFSQGLVWREKYNISRILDFSSILPDSVNTVTTLHTALYGQLGRNPAIHCVYDQKKDVNFLSEIRLCFDKSLQLIDCDGVKLDGAVNVNYHRGSVLTNCHISKPVHYPSAVPPLLQTKPVNRIRNQELSVVNLYKLLMMIIWPTL